MEDYPRGSKWRKWDLQVQPAENDWGSNFNPEDYKVKNRKLGEIREN